MYAETEAAGSQARAEEVVRCTKLLKQQNVVANKIEMLYAAMVTGQDSAEVLMEGLTDEETKQLEEYTATRRLEVESIVARTVEERCGVSLSRRSRGGRHEVMEATSYLVNEVLHASLSSGAAVARGERHPGRAVITVWRPYVASEEEITPVEYQMQEGGVYAISGLDLSPRSYVNQWVRDECIADALRTTNLRPVLPDTLIHLHGHTVGVGVGDTSIERMKIAQVAPCVASLPPRVLIAKAMPRATPGLDGMPAIASAFTWIQNSSCDQNVFDFTGILIRAGPIHHQPINRLYPHYQWAFLADPQCESNNEHGERPWMLAVRLQGTIDAIDWFEPSVASPSNHLSEFWVTLKDLECMARDDTYRAWQAVGSQHSVVKVAVIKEGGNQMPEATRRLVSMLTPAAESLLGC
jgi:hypothetical protein